MLLAATEKECKEMGCLSSKPAEEDFDAPKVYSWYVGVLCARPVVCV